jgi:hypothetical protein
MLGINPSTCVQVALIKIPRTGRGRGTRHRTPTAIRIGGINPSISVQIAPVVILAAGLGVGRSDVRRRGRDHSYRQRSQEPEDPKTYHGISIPAPRGGWRAQIGLFVVSFTTQSVAIAALLWFAETFNVVCIKLITQPTPSAPVSFWMSCSLKLATVLYRIR